MKEGSFGLRFAAVVVVLAMAPAAAMAYIDPGSGAYMVQALFTLAGAALFYVRHPVRSAKVVWKALARRVKPSVALQQEEPAGQQEEAVPDMSGAEGKSTST